MLINKNSKNGISSKPIRLVIIPVIITDIVRAARNGENIYPSGAPKIIWSMAGCPVGKNNNAVRKIVNSTFEKLNPNMFLICVAID